MRGPYRYRCECGALGPIRGSAVVAERDADRHRFASGDTWQAQHAMPKIESVREGGA